MDTIPRVLVVDSPGERDLVRGALETKPGAFDVVEVTSRADLEARLREGGFDALLTDFDVLGFHDLEVVEAVRALDAHLPVVIVTPPGREDQAAAAVQHGTTSYALKTPTISQRLPLILQCVIERERLRVAEAHGQNLIAYQARLLDSVHDAVIATDKAMHITAWNRAAETMYGWPLAHVIGQPIEQFLPSGFSSQQNADALRILEEHGRYQTEALQQRRDHTPFWVEGTVIALRDPQGQTTGYVAVNRDVSARHEAESKLREGEELFRSLSACSPAGIFLTDAQGRCIYSNPRLQAIAGFSLQESLGEGYQNFIHPDDREWVAREWAEYAGQGLECVQHYRFVTPSEDVRWVNVRTAPIYDKNGHRTGHVGTVEDVTERHQAEAALRESEDHFRGLIENSLDLIAVLDVTGVILYQSPSSRRVLGFTPAQMEGRNAFELVHPDDAGHVAGVLRYVIENPGMTQKTEFRLLHSDGSWRCCEAIGQRLGAPQGQAKGERIVVNTRDITDRKAVEARLAHNAFFDGLTGLSNRARFVDHLGQSIARRKRQPDGAFAVLFLDLDRFKNVNDSLGHMNGDRLLVQVADRLKHVVRPDDTMARLGGDEFAILMDDIQDLPQATHVASRVLEALSGPFDLDGHEVFAPASIGIVLGGRDGVGRPYEQPEDVLRDADTAMYRAKASGKARYEVFDIAMHTQVMARLQLEIALRRAVESASLDKAEFFLQFQPIMNLQTGHIAGVEALARWQPPERGLVSPGEFVPAAEETGLIVPLGFWVLETACRQMAVWRDRLHLSRAGDGAPFSISVNVSSRQFSQPDFASQVKRVLRESGLEPGFLKLEITESVLMENVESASAMLRQFHDIGVQLSMDDFGTGYSSLSYLHRFPLDILKIDRSFVADLERETGGWALARTIVNMADDLGMQAVAEGIETPDQLAHLRALHCSFGQGYFFARPLDVRAATDFIAHNLPA